MQCCGWGAIQQNIIKSIDQKLTQFLPAEANYPYKTLYDKITIKHLLTMTSGIDFNNTVHYRQMLKADNWVQYVKERPVLYEPGMIWKYKADPTLLSGIISQTCGMSMYEFAKRIIFNKIGIQTLTWQNDPAGNTSGNGDIYATAKDYARFGFLYLNNGMWDGNQILPNNWVELSTLPCKSDKRESCNCWTSQGTMVPQDTPLEYGFLWWCRKLPNVPNDAYYAFGGYGQFIVVVPSLDLVVVRLGNDPGKTDYFMLQSFMNLIVDAIKE